jgi:hypothetical protein
MKHLQTQADVRGVIRVGERIGDFASAENSETGGIAYLCVFREKSVGSLTIGQGSGEPCRRNSLLREAVCRNDPISRYCGGSFARFCDCQAGELITMARRVGLLLRAERQFICGAFSRSSEDCANLRSSSRRRCPKLWRLSRRPLVSLMRWESSCS